MRFLKRSLAFLLLASTLLLSACTNVKDNSDGSGTDNTANTTDTINYVSIVDNGASDYLIITPKGRTDIYTSAYSLSRAIEEATGASLKVLQDTYAEQAKEILVGITSRSVEGNYAEGFKTPDDFSVCVAGDKVMIYGQSQSAVDAGIEYFVENYISGTAEKTLKIPQNLSHTVLSNNEYLTITSGNASEYSIAVDAASVEHANTLRTAIKKLTGASLSINTGATASPKEIVLGDSRRSETLQVQKLVGSAFDTKIAVVGQKLVFACGSSEALEHMVSDFEEELRNYMFGGNLMIAKSFTKSEAYGKELAENVLESIGFTMTGSTALTSKAEVSDVYVPDGSDDAWYYSHHPFMTYFNGKYYIFYSLGRRNEDDLGQKVMMATSADYKNWTLSPLMDSLQGKHSEEVLTAFGLYEYEGTLTVYIYAYEYAENTIGKNPDGTPLRPKDDGSVTIVKERKRVYYMQTTDGVNWSEPKYMKDWTGGGGNQSPERFGDLLIWAGFGTLSYTTDLTGISGWKDVYLKLDPDTKRPKAITESGLYQTADGTIVIMSRTNDSNMLAAASFDGGYTWTNMYKAKFNDYSAKFQFGTLPDGRYYYVGNLSTKRSELVLLTSTDGVNFGTPYILGNTPYVQQKEGLYKAGNYGYPTTYIDDEYLCVVFSCGKEALKTLRVKLSDIGVK